MAYKTESIRNIMAMIGKNEVYLPALQRHFVWNSDKIELLFDSIMKDYPIGTFLFWKVNNELANTYTFYKFIGEYHERDKRINEKALQPEMKDEIIGVLDGQQRLSSMYIALQGTYAYKLPRKRYNNDDAYPKRELYLNLLHNLDVNDSTDRYEFVFLTKEESSGNDTNHYWFKVKDIIGWDEDGPSDYVDAHDEIVANIEDTKKSQIKRQAEKMLKKLWTRIHQDQLINYFEISNPNLDEILDIFVRVNSAGQQLSKSDLLFSTIVANWDEAREEIEALLNKMNAKGEGFRFNTDFVIRECLVLTGSPILFKVETFKKGNIDLIKSEWSNISKALLDTVDLLVEFGYSNENLTSYNSVMPISYYLYKGGKKNQNDKLNMKKYLAVSMLNGVFGTHGDSVLRDVRNAFNRRDKYDSFEFDWIKTVKILNETPYVVNDEVIDSLFENNQKNSYTFMILSLLYPHLKLNQYKFHQDHIHPYSKFKKDNLEKMGISKDTIEEWQTKRNKVANLQLLEGIENQQKLDAAFSDWFNDSNNVSDKAEYKRINYIPDNVSLDLKDFDTFYEERKKLMVKQLKKLLM